MGKKGNKQLEKMEEVRRFKFNNVISMCVVKLLKHFQEKTNVSLSPQTHSITLKETAV